MKANDAEAYWDFDSELKDDSIIQCPDCKEWKCISEWTESDMYCELCGEHPAVKCPDCDERFDLIFSRIIKVKKDD